jgi:hypothetical protein
VHDVSEIADTVQTSEICGQINMKSMMMRLVGNLARKTEYACIQGFGWKARRKELIGRSRRR